MTASGLAANLAEAGKPGPMAQILEFSAKPS